MAKHDRNLLNVTAIEAFAKFATTVGAKVRPGKGDYQLLQVKTVGPDWYAICKNAEGVVTTPPSIRALIQQFKARPMNDAYIGPVSVKDHAELYAADLRDDAAIEFMSALTLKHSVPHEMTDAQIQAQAKLAYRMADALLIAGGHA